MATVVAWSLLRSFIVGHTLHRYGVEPWAYFVVDLASSIPYAMASSQLINALSQRDSRRARRSALAAMSAFIAPDLYLLLAAKNMPASAYAALFGVVVLLALIGVWSVVSAVRSRLGEREPAINGSVE